MSNIAAIMDVFNIEQLNSKTKARLIIKLGRAINNEMGMNLTEELVYELVTLIDPDNETMKEEHYQRYAPTIEKGEGK